jgi:cellobiose transport system permease protein
VFFIGQDTAEAVPDELLEAATVGGASTLRGWFHLVLPAAVLGLLTSCRPGTRFCWPWSCSTPDNATAPVTGTALATPAILALFACSDARSSARSWKEP